MDPVEPGLACGSDTAHLSLFGYDPRTHYRGRGAFESMGAGLDMAPGDIAFKCNFATLDPASGVVLRRRADRRFEELGPLLCAALDGAALPSFPQHAVSVKYATEHRCGVVVRGAGLTDQISGTDPLRDNLPLQARPSAAGAFAWLLCLSACLPSSGSMQCRWGWVPVLRPLQVAAEHLYREFDAAMGHRTASRPPPRTPSLPKIASQSTSKHCRFHRLKQF